MPERGVEPQRITKPIQLLAAWLSGLVLVNGAFLAAARFLASPSWVPAALSIAAIANVQLFLGCIFLLQTKFRPEMQEDTFYSEYLGVRRATGAPDLIATEIATLQASFSSSTESLFGLVQSLQQQNVDLASEIRSIVQPGTRQAAIVALDRVVQQSQENVARLETASEAAERTRVMVRLNKRLATSPLIATLLEERGISIANRFGEDPIRESVITVGERVPLLNLREILDIVGDQFQWIDLSLGDRHANEVLLGSYSIVYADPFRGVRLTPDLRAKLMSPELKRSEFMKLVTRPA